jgi:hypothetical protein
VELSSYGRGFRTKNCTRLSRRIQAIVQESSGIKQLSASSIDACCIMQKLPSSIQHLGATVAYPFEYQAASDYSSVRNVPVYCIDISAISRERVKVLKNEALSRTNIRYLMHHPDSTTCTSISRCYMQARAQWHYTSPSLTHTAVLHNNIDYERELHMSRRIKNLIKKHPHTVLAHVGGWEHITGSSTLYQHLADLAPQRILLDDDEIKRWIASGRTAIETHLDTQDTLMKGNT